MGGGTDFCEREMFLKMEIGIVIFPGQLEKVRQMMKILCVLQNTPCPKNQRGSSYISKNVRILISRSLSVVFEISSVCNINSFLTLIEHDLR